MKNKDVAKHLRLISFYLSIDGEVSPFEIRAFDYAAKTIEGLGEDISLIAKNKSLRSLDGVGEKIEQIILEFLKNKSSSKLDELKKKWPIDVESLLTIEHIGPKKIRHLYDELRIKNISDLKRAVLGGKLEHVEGFGKKSQDLILEHFNVKVKNDNKRVDLSDAKFLANQIVSQLKPFCSSIQVAGSIRRNKSTIGDIDLLATTNNVDLLIEKFIKLKGVKEVLFKGAKRVTIIHDMQIDLRIIPKISWGAALLYFTGSKQFNIRLRSIAKKKGFKLNEYGLFTKDGVVVAQKTEKSIFKKLGINFVEPVNRESTSELDTY